MSKLKDACDLSPEKFRIVKLQYDAVSETVDIVPVVSSSMSDGNYESFFDGAKFVQWSDIKTSKVAITNRCYLTGKSLKLMQSELLYDRTKDIQIDGFSTEHLSINFVQDVPGCGKTHCIVENVPLEIKKEVKVVSDESTWSWEMNSCLVLTPTRESCDEIRSRLGKKGLSKQDQMETVMTIDSYLYNKIYFNYNKISPLPSPILPRSRYAS